MHQPSRRLFFGMFLVAALLPLAACTGFFDKGKSKRSYAKKAPVTAGAESYVTQLSLSRIALTSNPDDDESIARSLAVIKGYHTAKKPKTQSVVVAVIDYKFKDKSGSGRVLAPVGQNTAEFPALKNVIATIRAQPASVQNIKLVSASVTPDASLTLPEEDGALGSALDELQDRIESNAYTLPTLDAITLQLAMVEFLMRQKFRDSSYIAVDNVKHDIGRAAQNGTADVKKLNALTAKLDELETRLKKEMPYSL